MVKLDSFEEEVNFGLESGKRMSLCVYKDFEKLNSSQQSIVIYIIHRKKTCRYRHTKEKTFYIKTVWNTWVKLLLNVITQCYKICILCIIFAIQIQ